MISWAEAEIDKESKERTQKGWKKKTFFWSWKETT